MNKNKLLKINLKDGKEIELILGKIVHSKSNKEMIYFDKMDNNRWRVIVSQKTISDFNDIANIEIIWFKEFVREIP